MIANLFFPSTTPLGSIWFLQSIWVLFGPLLWFLLLLDLKESNISRCLWIELMFLSLKNSPQGLFNSVADPFRFIMIYLCHYRFLLMLKFYRFKLLMLLRQNIPYIKPTKFHKQTSMLLLPTWLHYFKLGSFGYTWAFLYILQFACNSGCCWADIIVM